jgi:septum formation topological specificity factor MinE
MIHRKKIDVDIIKDILEAMLVAKPNAVFIKSLAQQYDDRGNLSKKQLQGLLAKASGVESIAAHKLATLEAEILKRPTKYKSVITTTVNTPAQNNDNSAALINAILLKYPGHKRVIFLKTKLETEGSLTVTEKNELEKFTTLLLT